MKTPEDPALAQLKFQIQCLFALTVAPVVAGWATFSTKHPARARAVPFAEALIACADKEAVEALVSKDRDGARAFLATAQKLLRRDKKTFRLPAPGSTPQGPFSLVASFVLEFRRPGRSVTNALESSA